MKILQIVFASVLLLLFVSPLAMAVETEDYYNAQLEASGAGTLVDEVPDSVREQMGELGIDKLDFSSLFNSSPRKLVELFFEIIRNEYVSPFKTLFAIMSTLILLSVADIFGISSGNNSRAF